MEKERGLKRKIDPYSLASGSGGGQRPKIEIIDITEEVSPGEALQPDSPPRKRARIQPSLNLRHQEDLGQNPEDPVEEEEDEEAETDDSELGEEEDGGEEEEDAMMTKIEDEELPRIISLASPLRRSEPRSKRPFLTAPNPGSRDQLRLNGKLERLEDPGFLAPSGEGQEQEANKNLQLRTRSFVSFDVGPRNLGMVSGIFGYWVEIIPPAKKNQRPKEQVRSIDPSHSVLFFSSCTDILQEHGSRVQNCWSVKNDKLVEYLTLTVSRLLERARDCFDTYSQVHGQSKSQVQGPVHPSSSSSSLASSSSFSSSVKGKGKKKARGIEEEDPHNTEETVLPPDFDTVVIEQQPSRAKKLQWAMTYILQAVCLARFLRLPHLRTPPTSFKVISSKLKSAVDFDPITNRLLLKPEDPSPVSYSQRKKEASRVFNLFFQKIPAAQRGELELQGDNRLHDVADALLQAAYHLLSP